MIKTILVIIIGVAVAAIEVHVSENLSKKENLFVGFITGATVLFIFVLIAFWK